LRGLAQETKEALLVAPLATSSAAAAIPLLMESELRFVGHSRCWVRLGSGVVAEVHILDAGMDAV